MFSALTSLASCGGLCSLVLASFGVFLFSFVYPELCFNKGRKRFDAFYRGKRVVVTGAASGIGKGIAQRLHAAGATLLAVDRNATALSTLAQELNGVHTLAVDVTDSAAGELIVKTSVDQLGGLDMLVNNAGINVSEPLRPC